MASSQNTIASRPRISPTSCAKRELPERCGGLAEDEEARVRSEVVIDETKALPELTRESAARSHSGGSSRSRITIVPFGCNSVRPRSSRSFITRLTISREARTIFAMSWRDTLSRISNVPSGSARAFGAPQHQHVGLHLGAHRRRMRFIVDQAHLADVVAGLHAREDYLAAARVRQRARSNYECPSSGLWKLQRATISRPWRAVGYRRRCLWRLQK